MRNRCNAKTHRFITALLLLAMTLAASASDAGIFKRKSSNKDSADVKAKDSTEEADKEQQRKLKRKRRNLSAYSDSTITLPILTKSDENSGVEPLRKGTTFAINVSRDENAINFLTGDLPCASAIADAISQRLIENLSYSTVSREHVESIFKEQDLNWGGRFDTSKVEKLGRLLGAQVLIYVKVSYCQLIPDIRDAPEKKKSDEEPSLFKVDESQIKTNPGVVRKAGKAVNKKVKSLLPAKWQQNLDKFLSEREERFAHIHAMIYAVDLKTGEKFAGISSEVTRSTEFEPSPNSITGKLLIIRAANAIAADFIDRLLDRPKFVNVHMYNDTAVSLRKGLRLVRLGDCEEAVEFYEKLLDRKIDVASDNTNGRILHNLGVALICAERHEEALEKLRASYRLMESRATLDMITMAYLLNEQALDILPDTEKRIQRLITKTKEDDDFAEEPPQDAPAVSSRDLPAIEMDTRPKG